MKKPNDNSTFLFKSTAPAAATALIIPEPVGKILDSAAPGQKMSRHQDGELLANVHDHLLAETGLTRRQPDFELYRRTMQEDWSKSGKSGNRFSRPVCVTTNGQTSSGDSVSA